MIEARRNRERSPGVIVCPFAFACEPSIKMPSVAAVSESGPRTCTSPVYWPWTRTPPGYLCEANAAHYRVLADLRRGDQAAGCGLLNNLNASYGFYGHSELLKTQCQLIQFPRFLSLSGEWQKLHIAPATSDTFNRVRPAKFDDGVRLTRNGADLNAALEHRRRGPQHPAVARGRAGDHPGTRLFVAHLVRA